MTVFGVEWENLWVLSLVSSRPSVQDTQTDRCEGDGEGVEGREGLRDD